MAADDYQVSVEKLAGRKFVHTEDIQKWCLVGYFHAARLLERMERDGRVSPASKTGVRAVLPATPAMSR